MVEWSVCQGPDLTCLRWLRLGWGEIGVGGGGGGGGGGVYFTKWMCFNYSYNLVSFRVDVFC